MAWSDLQDNYVRVSETFLCPICGKSDGCLVRKTGELVICVHTPSDIRWDIGYAHILDEADAGEIVANMEKREPTPPKIYHIDFNKRHDIFRASLTRGKRRSLAASLGVSLTAINELDVGWSSVSESFMFPISGSMGKIIGIQHRMKDGKKPVMKGSKLGVFLPRCFNCFPNTSVFVCEGASDTMAALDLGLNAIGRFSCNTSGDYIADITINMVVYIISDHGAPGEEGAAVLCERLKDTTVQSKVIHLPYCTGTIKDLRSLKKVYGGLSCLRWILKQCNV